MLPITFWSFWTETIEIVLAYLLMLVVKSTLEPSQFAEAPLVEWTVLCSFFNWVNVTVHAFVPLSTVSLLNEVLARRYLILLIYMQVLTIITLLAQSIQPMHAYSSLTLGLVYPLVLGLKDCTDLVY